jgi:hypothetical protein
MTVRERNPTIVADSIACDKLTLSWVVVLPPVALPLKFLAAELWFASLELCRVCARNSFIARRLLRFLLQFGL